MGFVSQKWLEKYQVHESETLLQSRNFNHRMSGKGQHAITTAAVAAAGSDKVPTQVASSVS